MPCDAIDTNYLKQAYEQKKLSIKNQKINKIAISHSNNEKYC